MNGASLTALFIFCLKKGRKVEERERKGEKKREKGLKESGRERRLKDPL